MELCSKYDVRRICSFYAVPRYSKIINYYDKDWEDVDWPKPTKMVKIFVEQNILNKIINDLRKSE